jgi:HIV-1 Vpr-binding protein
VKLVHFLLVSKVCCLPILTHNNLFQAPPTDRYLHDLTQYAFGVLHITTLVPYCRKLIVHATLSNNRVGMSVLLDAANSFGYVDPEVRFLLSNRLISSINYKL